MKRWLVVALLSVGLVVLLGPWTVPQAHGAQKTDFALLDEETGVGDLNVICSCVDSHGKPRPCQIKITMGNRGDLGGDNGFVRTTYNDLDFVDYPILANTTVNITLAAGGGSADKAIKVSGDGAGGSVLIGQMSAERLAGSGVSCCTTAAASPDCQTFPIP